MDNTIRQAEEALQRGQVKEAETLISPVLEKEPDNIRALSVWGAVCHSRQRLSEAKKAFERILELNPDSHQNRKSLVLTLLSGPQPAQAKEHLEKLLSVNQNDFQLWALMAQMEKATGDLQAAAKHAQRSLLINPEQPGLKAWVDTLGKEETPAPAVPLKLSVNQMSFLSPPGQEEEIDLLGSKLEKYLFCKKVVSLKEDPYLTALSGRGGLWIEGLTPRTVPWLSRLSSGPRPVILRIGPDDLKGEVSTFPLTAVTSVLAETKAVMDLFLGKGAKLSRDTRLYLAPRAMTVASKPVEISPDAKISLAYLGSWRDPAIILSALSQIRGQFPEATLLARERPQDLVVARYVDYYISANGLAGQVLFGSGAIGDSDFYRGRTHLLVTDLMAGGYTVPKALGFGLYPLIHSSPGAAELYPADYLWSTLSDLPVRLAEKPREDPRTLVQRVFSPDRLADRVRGILV